MPTVDVVVDCPVSRTFRVEQMAGMFDVALEAKSRAAFSVELPGLDEQWQIGAIVGPSGSGKSTIARAHFGRRLYTPGRWRKGESILDGFDPRLSIKTVVQTLTAVGFSSPPSWVKPYQVLSNGERFRCDLARALLDNSDDVVVAYDEFTSVVDRTVAKIGSAAVAKAIRKRRITRRFVAVTCHYDVLDWLQPDWTLDMASCRLARGCLRRRPPIELTVAPVHRSAWVLFRRHHYLNGNLLGHAKCFAAFWGERPVAFSAWVRRNTRKCVRGDMREHRTVVLPDFQGLGIGNRLSEFCASIWAGLGGRAFGTTSHPAMIGYRLASPRWRCVRRPSMVSRTGGSGMYLSSARRHDGTLRPGVMKNFSSCRRLTAGFQYSGPAMDRPQAENYAAAHPRVFALSESEQAILAAVNRWPGATASLLARLLGVSTSAIRSGTARLLALDLIARAGRGGQADPLAFYPAEAAKP